MVIAMMMFSTVYEVYCNVKDVKRNQILCSFSVYSNSKLIMTLKPLSSKEMLFLHGIRSLLIIWIVFGHTFTMTYYLGPVINSQSLYGLLKSFYSVFLFSGVLAVDTFFMLSAMLMSMSVFRQLEAT